MSSYFSKKIFLTYLNFIPFIIYMTIRRRGRGGKEDRAEEEEEISQSQTSKQQWWVYQNKKSHLQRKQTVPRPASLHLRTPRTPPRRR